MKGTENIVAHISSEAQAKAEEILAAAGAKCAEIRDEYDKKAKAVYAEKVRAGVKDCEDRAESMNKIAGMEARKSMLSLKQELVSACFDKAGEMLIALPEDRYVDLLAKLAAESAVSGEEELLLNAKDKAALGEKALAAANALLEQKGLPGKLSLADAVGDFSGGLVLRRGNIETNCTAELLVSSCRNDMAATLAGVLFE